jgi:hypothetical protein
LTLCRRYKLFHLVSKLSEPMLSLKRKARQVLEERR